MLTSTTFVNSLKENIPLWTNEAQLDLNNSRAQWDFIKQKMGEFSRLYGTKAKKEQNILKNSLQKKIDILSQNLNDNNVTEYEEEKLKLKEIEDSEIRGAILRSNCLDYEFNEKSTKYFFNLEKNKNKQKTIEKLKKSDGTYTTDTEGILNECTNFYKSLFSKNANVNCHQDAFQNFYSPEINPRLSNEQKTTQLK